MESTQSLSESSPGDLSVLWIPCCLSYWPLGERQNRTFGLDRGNHMVCTLFVDDPKLFERAS